MGINPKNKSGQRGTKVGKYRKRTTKYEWYLTDHYAPPPRSAALIPDVRLQPSNFIDSAHLYFKPFIIIW